MVMRKKEKPFEFKNAPELTPIGARLAAERAARIGDVVARYPMGLLWMYTSYYFIAYSPSQNAALWALVWGVGAVLLMREVRWLVVAVLVLGGVASLFP